MLGLPSSFRRRKWVLGILCGVLKHKKNPTEAITSMGFWRRARDSNPRTGYSPLHDFQLLFKALKFVDIHRVLSPNILVATAKINILIILVSVIYATTIVVFPSSEVVYHCENIYPMKLSIHIQRNILKHLSKEGSRRQKGGRKSTTLIQVNNSGGMAGDFQFVVIICVIEKLTRTQKLPPLPPSCLKKHP